MDSQNDRAFVVVMSQRGWSILDVDLKGVVLSSFLDVETLKPSIGPSHYVRTRQRNQQTVSGFMSGRGSLSGPINLVFGTLAVNSELWP